MTDLKRFLGRWTLIVIATFLAVATLGLTLVRTVNAQSVGLESGEHLITVYDEGVERGILTRAETLREGEYSY
jgi:hypothetical protein